MVISVGVVGTSARAAVHSLARAGFSAWAVDQFADRDLSRVAPCTVCPPDRYPDALPELAAQFPPGPVLYTGGLENYPHIIAGLAAKRALWGNPPEVLARVRDPFAIFPTLAACGFAVPQLVPQGELCPAEGRWLRKPVRTGGGLGIRFARPGEPASPHHDFQEFIDGTPMSALFVSDPVGTQRNWATQLNGITEQLIGVPWLHAKQFGYCGNIGPIELPPELESRIKHNGLILNETLQQRGLWGLDFIYRDGVTYPVELNPRYTAGVEVLELAWHCSYLWAHTRCFTTTNALAKYKRWRRFNTVVGKAIYYSPRDFTFPQSGPWDADLAGEFDPWRLPGFADIPEPGNSIEAGQPVLTFFETGSTPAEVRQRLQSRAAELDLLLDAKP